MWVVTKYIRKSVERAGKRSNGWLWQVLKMSPKVHVSAFQKEPRLAITWIHGSGSDRQLFLISDQFGGVGYLHSHSRAVVLSKYQGYTSVYLAAYFLTSPPQSLWNLIMSQTPVSRKGTSTFTSLDVWFHSWNCYSRQTHSVQCCWSTWLR